MVALALATAALAFFAQPNQVFADDPPFLREGAFDGVWHTDPVRINIEKFNDDGSFSGEIQFDPNGRWGDVHAPFTGVRGKSDSLTVMRSDCPSPGEQIGRMGKPELRGRTIVWKGSVKGPNFISTFELCIPVQP